MCQISIKNIGPVKKVSLKLNKITTILGPQSSGKSTIAKILCHCQWVERNCFEDFEKSSAFFQADNNFINSLVVYHRMNGYINARSEISYIGDFVSIEFRQNGTKIVRTTNTEKEYLYPKLNYLPASRNMACLIPNLKKYNEQNDNLLYFMYEWTEAKAYQKDIDLERFLNEPIKYHLDSEKDRDVLIDDGHDIELQNASSGVQSLLPLISIIKYGMVDVYKRYKPLSAEQKMQVTEAVKVLRNLQDRLPLLEKLGKEKGGKAMLEELKKTLVGGNDMLTFMLQHPDSGAEVLASASKKFFYKNTRMYVEEPEQNLFPDAQARLLYWMVELLQQCGRDDTLFLTTHSPFILFALNNCMMGGLVEKNIDDKSGFESYSAWINPQLVSIYEFHDGELKPLQDNDGLLNDNYINKSYKQITNEYMKLLTHYGYER